MEKNLAKKKGPWKKKDKYQVWEGVLEMLTIADEEGEGDMKTPKFG